MRIQAPVSPAASQGTQPTVGGAPIYGITQLSPSATAYTGQYLSITSSAGPSSGGQKEQAYPERPGQPECQYYLRTGDCKFGVTCKYHHPPEWSASRANYVLSPMGLPLRPVSTNLWIVHTWWNVRYICFLFPAFVMADWFCMECLLGISKLLSFILLMILCFFYLNAGRHNG